MAFMEEFSEWDVMLYQNGEADDTNSYQQEEEEMKASRSSSASAPMSIPATRRSLSCGWEMRNNNEDAELVPPHVLVSRSRSGEKVAFSVCSGQGRTLKGRDLKHVRNSVLRMTGYLEGC